MPGGYEIQRTLEAVRHRPQSKGYLLLPLYGELAAEGSGRRGDALRPAEGCRRDERRRDFHHDRWRPSGHRRRSRAHSSIRPESRHQYASCGAHQPGQRRTASRARRAEPRRVDAFGCGRRQSTRNGRFATCRRSSGSILSEVVLTLKASGVEDLRKFRWLEAPSDAALNHAEDCCWTLEPWNKRRTQHTVITDLGRRMLAFPVHPRYARMLLAAQDFGCVYQACLVAALTQGRDLLMRNAGKEVTGRARGSLRSGRPGHDVRLPDSDASMGIRSENHFRMDSCEAPASTVSRRVRWGRFTNSFCESQDRKASTRSPGHVDEDALRKCILIGFSDRVARASTKGSHGVNWCTAGEACSSRESVVRESPLMVVCRDSGDRRKTWRREHCAFAGDVDRNRLASRIVSDGYAYGDARCFDTVSMRVRADDVLRFRDLAVTVRRVEPPPADAAARLLAEEVVAGRLRLSKWDHARRAMDSAAESTGRMVPGAWSSADSPRRPATHHRTAVSRSAGIQGSQGPRSEARVQSWLSASQRDLISKHAPERVTLTNGRTPRVTYEAEAGPPFISLRIQELFGVTQTPRIAQGRVSLSVHILAPSMRPVQVTQDLANFWREHYPRIKSELQRKYPRHEWR